MKLIFTLLLINVFLAGCSLEDKDTTNSSGNPPSDQETPQDQENSAKDPDQNLYGLWKLDADDAPDQYMQITASSAVFWSEIAPLSCLRRLDALVGSLEITDNQLSFEFHGQHGSLTLVADNQLQTSTSGSEELIEYSRYLGELPASCGSDSTKQVEVKITFQHLPELLEQYQAISSKDEFFYGTRIKFDMDDNGEISVGDMLFFIDSGFSDIATAPSWQSLTTTVGYVYQASANGYSTYYVAKLTSQVQGQEMTLTGKSADFKLIDNISTGTQVLIDSSYELNGYYQRDYFPEDYDTFTSGLDTSLLEDAEDDIYISFNWDVTPMVDIRKIEISIIE